MDILVQTISKTLESNSFCMVPEAELERVWPDRLDRPRSLSRLVAKHDWLLFSYVHGNGAIILRKNAPMTQDWSSR